MEVDCHLKNIGHFFQVLAVYFREVTKNQWFVIPGRKTLIISF